MGEKWKTIVKQKIKPSLVHHTAEYQDLPENVILGQQDSGKQKFITSLYHHSSSAEEKDF